MFPSLELWLLAVAAAFLCGGILWGAILRSQVRHQSATLREWIRREAALRKRFVDLFENSTDAVYTHDLNYTITSWNRTAESLTGFTRDEVLSRNIAGLLTAESLERATEMTKLKLQGSASTTYEIEFVAKDGRTIPVEVSTRLVAEDGKVLGIQGAARDISERKRAEEEWRQAKEAAEAASRAKSEFLANVSHEIRTPLNGVVGMTELALETSLTSEQREYLEAVRSSASSLLGVINDILDFSKIEARKLELDSVEFRLTDMLAEAMKPLAIRAQQKGLQFRLEISSGVPAALEGDPGRLRQILVNLLANATKFTEKGEILLSVETESAAPENLRLHFSVRDTGVGIPPEKHAWIFEPFAQADGSTKRRFSGTGLGLTICARLVEMMGGKIWLESELGKGSTFHFTACFRPVSPLRVEGLPPDLHEERIGADQERCALPSAGRKLQILLVEDNDVNRTLVTHLLVKRGHVVVEAQSGKEAVEVIERASARVFDLVFMDVQMPDMDGFETTAAIRAHEKLSGGHVPIIALTAYAMKGDRERCLAAGMDGYLSKPAQLHELRQLLRRYEGGPAVEAALPTPREELCVAGDDPEPSPPQPRGGEHGPVDRGALLDRLSGDVQLMNDLIEIHLSQSPGLLAAAGRALQENNGPELARLIHTLKGSAGNLLALGAVEIAGRVETFAEQGDFSRARETMAALECELERVEHGLRALQTLSVP